MCRNLSFIVLLLFTEALYAQINVVNGGFEDQAADATVPKGWMPCEENTTPDILPGFWGEYGDASQGKTYIGLITRDDGTFESIGQKLSKSLKAGECYEFKIDLRKGAIYAGFIKPLKLRIWMGESLCDMDQVVYLSSEIKHIDWKSYLIQFSPKKEYKYIRIEAHYKDGDFSYKGNVILDNMTSIKKCSRA
jgi:hypothetical protein